MYTAALVVACLANTEYQSSIPNGGNVISSGVAWGAVGHVNANGVGGVDAFGTDFLAEGLQWTSSLCNTDSDGDGYTNGQELGDPSCTWTVGSIPSRVTEISNPGRSDSTPVSNDATGITSVPSTPVPTAATLQPTPTPTTAVSNGNSPGTTAGSIGEVQVSFSSDSSCSRISSTVQLSNADAVCRTVTTTPTAASTRYGVAHCDSAAGVIYVQAPFTTLSDCISEAGTLGQLVYSPSTLKFDLVAGVGGCTAYVSNGVTSYVKLARSTCSGAGGGTPSVPTVPLPQVPGTALTPNPTQRTPTPTSGPEEEEAVPTWMIVVLVVLVVALVVACVYMAIDCARHTSHLGTEDGVTPQGEEFDGHDMHPSKPRPHGPPVRAIEELTTNPATSNPIGTAFGGQAPSTYR